MANVEEVLENVPQKEIESVSVVSEDGENDKCSDNNSLEGHLEKLNLANHNSDSSNDPGLLGSVLEDSETVRFSSQEIYRYALKFYKEKEGKAIHVAYSDKCHLSALIQQVSQGPFDPSTSAPLGVFDMVGRDRRVAWQALGDMNQENAMNEFISKLTEFAPSFRPYIDALWANHLEEERLQKEREQRMQEEMERQRLEEEERKHEKEEQIKQEETKRQIQEALNNQTFSQFRSYAEQQYPGNPEQQGVLIRQLQDQHYQQYMQQVYQQQLLLQQQNEEKKEEAPRSGDEKTQESNTEQEEAPSERTESPNGYIVQDDVTDEEECESELSPASMWTRRDIVEFKEAIIKEGGESIIKVGHGETVTVRVPTHEEGTCLFWEFATDNYDIGFGVYFEWIKDPSQTVSVHISESEEDEDDDEDGEDDIERLAGKKLSDKPPMSVVIPVYRRDCHEEVYAGSHMYPSTGVYLLKFDNSYSMWRSKTLYYRVYYTK